MTATALLLALIKLSSRLSASEHLLTSTIKLIWKTLYNTYFPLTKIRTILTFFLILSKFVELFMDSIPSSNDIKFFGESKEESKN
jgi:hypothetical protein